MFLGRPANPLHDREFMAHGFSPRFRSRNACWRSARVLGGFLPGGRPRSLAEEVGFEPTGHFTVRRFSGPLASTTRPLFRIAWPSAATRSKTLKAFANSVAGAFKLSSKTFST